MQTIYLFIFASSNWNKSNGRKELIRREVARTNSIFSGFLGRTDWHVCVVQHEQAKIRCLATQPWKCLL